MRVLVTVECELRAKGDGWEFARKDLLRMENPTLNRGSFGSNGWYTLKPVRVRSVRKAPSPGSRGPGRSP